MNSTGSRHPPWVNRTTVSSPSARRSKVIVVPTHSTGPATQRHATRLGGASSAISIVAPRSGIEAEGEAAADRGVAGDVGGPPAGAALERGQGVVDLGERGADADAVSDVVHGWSPGSMCNQRLHITLGRATKSCSWRQDAGDLGQAGPARRLLDAAGE